MENNDENNDILKFFQNLLLHLDEENNRLKTSCLTLTSKNDELCAKRKTVLSNIGTVAFTGSHIYLAYLTHATKNWQHFLQDLTTQNKENSTLYTMNADEFRKATKEELNSNTNFDKFTMTPFHDVELEINALKEKVENLIKETVDAITESEITCQNLKNEMNEINDQIEIFDSYGREIKEEITKLSVTLSEKRREERLNCTQDHFKLNEINKLNMEIAKLRNQIVDIKKHN